MKRFDFDTEPIEDMTGEYVRYKDARTEIDRLTERIAELETERKALIDRFNKFIG